MQSRMRRLALALVSFSLVISSAADAQPALKAKVRVASVVSAAWLPLWVAKDKGLFEARGLDVDITTVQNVSTVIGALGRQFEVSGCTPIDIIKARLKKLDVVGIAANTRETSGNQQMRLVVPANGPVKSFSDLKGQVVATPSLNGVIHIATLHALKQQGVDPKDVRFQEMSFSNMSDQIAAGRVAAAEIVEPFVSALKVQTRSLGDPMLSVADPVVLTCWMASGAWAHNNPAAVAAWRGALGDAIEYIQKNDHDARMVLAKWTRLPDEVARSVRLPAYTPRLEESQIGLWATTSFGVGAIDAPFSPADSTLP